MLSLNAARNLASSAIVAVAAAALVLVAGPVHAAPRLTGEAQLAKMLKGRVAGKPEDCISFARLGSSTIVDRTAIVYQDGSTLWVNRPSNPESLHSDDILVSKTSMSQLCRLDIVQLRDRSAFFFTGSVGLQQFVPYRLDKTASRD